MNIGAHRCSVATFWRCVCGACVCVLNHFCVKGHTFSTQTRCRKNLFTRECVPENFMHERYVWWAINSQTVVARAHTSIKLSLLVIPPTPHRCLSLLAFRPNKRRKKWVHRMMRWLERDIHRNSQNGLRVLCMRRFTRDNNTLQLDGWAFNILFHMYAYERRAHIYNIAAATCEWSGGIYPNRIDCVVAYES